MAVTTQSPENQICLLRLVLIQCFLGFTLFQPHNIYWYKATQNNNDRAQQKVGYCGFLEPIGTLK